MNTSTERPARKPSSKNNKRYYKQTAHVEARRDGKPLIFGWGKHLSHSEKVRMQRRGVWVLAVLIVALLATVIVGAWINLNIIVPGLPITTVNGHPIPQSQYRMMVAVKTQLGLNGLYGPDGLTTQVTNLQKQDAQVKATITQDQKDISTLEDQIKKLPSGSSTQRTDLEKKLADAKKKLSDDQAQDQKLTDQISTLNNATIPLEKQGFTQSQIGNDSATWLQDDELLREWLATQPASVQAKINPGATQVNNDFNDLKKNMPTTNGYNTVFSSMGISDSDIRAMLTIIDRRTNLQKFLEPQIQSPSYQVLARQIVVPTKQKATQLLQDLQKGQDFGKLAKANSQDVNTKDKGGDLGWLTRYQYIDTAGSINGSPVIDNWIFDPARKLNETSEVLYANSAYYIVQIMNIDPSRTVNADLLKALKQNAATNWLQERRWLPEQKIIAVDQTMLLDTNNMPPNNILPSSPPATNDTGATPTTETTPTTEATPTTGTTPEATPTAGS